MKKVILILTVVFSLNFYAQAPITTQKLTYQAVVRGQTNFLQINTAINVKVSLIHGGPNGIASYTETHKPVTNDNGLFTIKIGGGTILSGSYDDFKWQEGPVFLKTEIDFKDQWNIDFNFVNTSELLSVPYANYSHKSGSLIGDAYDFVGVYKGGGFYDYVFITYVGSDKVMFTYSYPDNSIGGEINYNSGLARPAYGKIVGNKITLYDEYGDTTVGTKIGNTITFDTPGGSVLLVKQE
jgi:hypothetical protein